MGSREDAVAEFPCPDMIIFSENLGLAK